MSDAKMSDRNNARTLDQADTFNNEDELNEAQLNDVSGGMRGQANNANDAKFQRNDDASDAKFQRNDNANDAKAL